MSLLDKFALLHFNYLIMLKFTYLIFIIEKEGTKRRVFDESTVSEHERLLYVLVEASFTVCKYSVE